MGIRSAIAKKLFQHMHKHDKQRHTTERETRRELRAGYQGNMAEGDGSEAKRFSVPPEQLKAALAHSRDREQGSRLRSRFKSKMKKWAGKGSKKPVEKEAPDDSSVDDKNHNIALPKWVVDVDQNNRLAEFEDLIKGVHKTKKKARHVSYGGETPATQDKAAVPEVATPAVAPAVAEAAPEVSAPAPRMKKKQRMALIAEMRGSTTSEHSVGTT